MEEDERIRWNGKSLERQRIKEKQKGREKEMIIERTKKGEGRNERG